MRRYADREPWARARVPVGWVIDVDPTICHQVGRLKHGAAFRCTTVLGYHPILATGPTRARCATPACARARRRGGSLPRSTLRATPERPASGSAYGTRRPGRGSTPGRPTTGWARPNSSTHKTPTIQRWLVRHPRFTLHFTRTYSSWLNLVERWFGELTTMDQAGASRDWAACPSRGRCTR